MKKQKITQQNYLKAHRKASREEEIARHGRPARFRAVHQSKKAYDRKREKAGLRNLPFSIFNLSAKIRYSEYHRLLKSSMKQPAKPPLWEPPIKIR